jgi:hypothetical protein
LLFLLHEQKEGERVIIIFSIRKITF